MLLGSQQPALQFQTVHQEPTRSKKEAETKKETRKNKVLPVIIGVEVVLLLGLATVIILKILGFF